jgi:hypothetical protein
MINNEINRIKELFTEERLYGNLVEQTPDYRRFFSCMDNTTDTLYPSPKGSWCLKIADGGNNAYNCGRYEQLGGYKIVFHDRVKHTDGEGSKGFKIEMKLLIDSGATANETDTSSFLLVFTLIDGKSLDPGFQWKINGEFRCTPNGNLEFKVNGTDLTACVDELKVSRNKVKELDIYKKINVVDGTYSGKEFQKMIQDIMRSYQTLIPDLKTWLVTWTKNSNCKNILGF